MADFFVKRQLTKKLENHSLILGDLTNQNSFWKCKVTWLFCDCHAVIIRLMSDISKMDSEFFLISLFSFLFLALLGKLRIDGATTEQVKKWIWWDDENELQMHWIQSSFEKWLNLLCSSGREFLMVLPKLEQEAS